ncbi:MAG TPA: adenylate/guanylate cyclase domain-containing protein [Candidatus Limnocylindrales bacterium]|nr:adenylate/guanylate cyclase domain-containing protein [Candidatus Limnocylindrales bacterium]
MKICFNKSQTFLKKWLLRQRDPPLPQGDNTPVDLFRFRKRENPVDLPKETNPDSSHLAQKMRNWRGKNPLPLPGSKAIILGFLVGISGLVIGLSPIGFILEENLGLNLLFRLRGARPPPPEVLIVNIDKASATHLKLSHNPKKWPRSLYARLTESLVKQGAAIIVFDLIFDEPGSPSEDALFADAIHKAGNVILFKYLDGEIVSLPDKKGLSTVGLNIERWVLPIPPLAQSALAIAPFPLPKVPARLNQYWMFKAGAGDMPTLPVVAFQTFALQVYDEFLQLLKKVNPAQAEKLPGDKRVLTTSADIENLILTLRSIFQNNPRVAREMLKELQISRVLVEDGRKNRILQSLIRMYQHADTQYLNFYGPSGTMPTVSYPEVLQVEEKSVASSHLVDLKGKVVFIGSSGNLRSELKDDFHTVFSQPNGLDLTGVEIAATAFANLLEDESITPPSLLEQSVIILLWGITLGILCRLLPIVLGAMGVLGLSILYLMATYYEFKTTESWYPVVIPLLFQVPLTFFGAVLWKYRDAHRERQNIREALGYYLPNEMVDQLAKNVAHIKTGGQLVYGVCLATDAEQYTPLAERVSPQQLSQIMNEYYGAVFEPVLQNSGVISDVIGDSMLALWVATQPDRALKNQACLAALGIAGAVDRFNQSSHNLQLPTRIGLHFGQMSLGNIGAIRHYEYRAVGDVVNTANRLQDLNKQMGTRILISSEVSDQLEGFLIRELGKFLLPGKSNPVGICELMGRTETCREQQHQLCAIFTMALEAFRRQSWEEAIEKLNEILKIHKNDGPSLFYLKLCKQYQQNPPKEPWDGTVRMKK